MLLQKNTHAASVSAENDIKGMDASVSVIGGSNIPPPKQKMTNKKRMSDWIMEC